MRKKRKGLVMNNKKEKVSFKEGVSGLKGFIGIMVMLSQIRE